MYNRASLCTGIRKLSCHLKVVVIEIGVVINKPRESRDVRWCCFLLFGLRVIRHDQQSGGGAKERKKGCAVDLCP